VIDRLVEQGLLTRVENPEDRRMMVLKATDQGEALVSELRDRRISHLTKALAELSPEELKTISHGLALLAKVTEAQSETGHSSISPSIV
jgi:DNA-binding MarR family transcriptional regulator